MPQEAGNAVRASGEGDGLPGPAAVYIRPVGLAGTEGVVSVDAPDRRPPVGIVPQEAGNAVRASGEGDGLPDPVGVHIRPVGLAGAERVVGVDSPHGCAPVGAVPQNVGLGGQLERADVATRALGPGEAALIGLRHAIVIGVHSRASGQDGDRWGRAAVAPKSVRVELGVHIDQIMWPGEAVGRSVGVADDVGAA